MRYYQRSGPRVGPIRLESFVCVFFAFFFPSEPQGKVCMADLELARGEGGGKGRGGYAVKDVIGLAVWTICNCAAGKEVGWVRFLLGSRFVCLGELGCDAK